MSPLEQYHALETRLKSLIPKFKFSSDINLKLERITRLLELMGNPQRQFKSIHVGGTSGKGSTSTMIAAMLTAAGYKTGLHTSPNLQIINERHQIDGVVASTSTLAALLDEMWPAIEQVGEEMPHFGRPSYFEAQFALTCLYFAREKIDVAVVEVGLGGRLDATNVLPSSVAVLVSVGLDHTAILGDTIEEIITDKAGIVKPNQVVVTGVTQPSARAIIANRAALYGNPLWAIGDQFDYEEAFDSADDDDENAAPKHTIYVNDRQLDDLEIGLIGSFQVANASCAVAAALAFAPGLSAEAIARGLRDVQLPGRMELIQSHPTVILDGAHNPDKMQHAAEALTYTDARVILVMAMKSDKDLQETLLHALPAVSQVIATEFIGAALWASVPADAIADTIRTLTPNMPVVAIPDPIAAVEAAIAAADPHDIIWITGSLYLVGDVRNYWYPKEKLLAAAEAKLASTLMI